MTASDYFNPVPLFILFREVRRSDSLNLGTILLPQNHLHVSPPQAIEASIVVSVLLTFVNRMNIPGLKAQSENQALIKLHVTSLISYSHHLTSPLSSHPQFGGG